MTGCNYSRKSALQRVVGASMGFILLVGTMAGCGGSAPVGVRTDFVPFTQEQKLDAEAHSTHSYLIQESDQIGVHFAYERSLSQDRVVILSDGTATLIGIDNIRLAGLTISQADSVLTAAYSQEYREPALSVSIQKTAGRRVYVLGEVKHAGLVQLPQGGVDILGAISVAGGFTADAEKAGAVVIRVTREGYQFQEVNLDNLGTADFVYAAAMPLQNYDVVYIPRSRIGDFGYFSRNVLAGFAYITRMIYDVQFISTGNLGR